MGTDNINNTLREKEGLISCADDYMYDLEKNPCRRVHGKELEIEREGDSKYKISTSFNGKKVIVMIPQEKIWKLAIKSNDENEVKEKIDAYICKKVYKQSIKQYESHTI